MKKFLLSLAMVVVALAANATTEDITAKFTYTWNNAESLTNNEDGSITFNAVSWGGMAAWLATDEGKCDWSAWKKVVFEFAEPTTVNTQILVGDASAWGDVGITSLECSFEGKDMSAIEQIALQASGATTITVTRVYLSDGEGEEEPAVKTAVLDNGSTHSLPAGDWGWDGSWLARDVTAFNAIVFEISSVTGLGQVTLQGIDINGEEVSDQIEIDKATVYVIDIEDWKTLNQYAFQNINVSSEDAEVPDGETTIVVKQVFLTSETVDEYLINNIHIYAIGNLDGCNGWDPSDGSLELAYDEEECVFKGTISVQDNWEGNGWFAFSCKLGADSDDWTTFNSARLSVTSDYGTLNETAALVTGADQSFKLPAGIYSVTIDPILMTITFATASENAIAGTSAISAAPSAYYSLSGARLAAPAKGVNIVKYADGSVKKVLVK
ncbi:MAG: hypothetical protein IJ635_08795 [Bacteroidaceae bacterium]|nr:hypothetical protein [Bacteroidaceae bacterium]